MGTGTMLPALGLGTRALPRATGQWDRPPRSPHESLLNKHVMRRAFLWYGMLGAAGSLLAYFFAQIQGGWHPGLPMFGIGADLDPVYVRATTMALAAIVFTQIGEVWNCRTEEASVFSVGLFSNKQINIGIVFEIFLIVLITLLPPLQGVFHTCPLNLEDYALLAVMPFVILAIEETRKAIVRAYHRKSRNSATPQESER